jgi:nicotinate-nucleotide adenylyltransferase
MRIALFGGTFDPPHRGHIAIAKAAADAFSLDRIFFAPTGKQPLKTTAPAASFEDRFAMVDIATSTDMRFSASLIDAPRMDGGPNYTVDALSRLGNLMAIEDATSSTMHCITGADAFLDLRRWRQPELLLELAEWIVVSRPGFSLRDLRPLALTPHQLARVHILDNIHEDISSTCLREALQAGLNIDDLLAPGVANYIHQHHLYTSK